MTTSTQTAKAGKKELGKVNVRRSVCFVALPFLLLTLTASPVVACAYYTANFWFAAQGACTMAFNPHMVPGTGYSTWDYFEQAVGSFVFVGEARVTDQVLSPWGYLYPAVDGTVKAYGWLKMSWSHDGKAYGLNVFIYSLPHTPAMIASDPDIFTHGTTYVPPEQLLGFTGTLRRGSVVERVQGNLGFLLVSVAGESSGNEFAVAGFHIYSLIDGKAVEFWWANSEISVPLPGDQLLVIPAARIFMHEVSVTPL